MAEGIIFGGHLLDKDTFIKIFEEWYNEKNQEFYQDLVVLKDEISQMYIMELRESQSHPGVWKNAMRRQSSYNAKKIYERWEQIQKKYFGNNAVTLIAITKFGEKELTWSQNIEEASVMTEGGINVTKTQLNAAVGSLDKDLAAYAAAQDIQSFFRKHYGDMCNQLTDYKMNNKDAQLLHQTISSKSPLYQSRHESFTGRSYGEIIFASQGNAEGKQLDAFMNHVAQYNKELFGLMSASTVNGNQLTNLEINDHGGFSGIFSSPQIVQPWLLASLNSASWLTGGDVVVIDEFGAVIYNIQIKSTLADSGKNFELALTRLENLIDRLIKRMKKMHENPRLKPRSLANMMYKSLKTTSSNDVTRSESFMETEAYNTVRKNLNLSPINIEFNI